MNRYVCLHGHFYQPPRENPWLEEVELQDSAHPYHDWNERISAECYQRNAASRILDEERRIVDIVNNYARMSFNFGPTLLSWMARRQPGLHQALVAADQDSRERFGGHGSAIAQVYNHIIMPLANSRDKRTQVRWGVRDFESRFGRHPEGMWLAETAVDLETLDILSEEGLRFTLLAPRQARRVRPLAGGPWQEVADSVDPKLPYLCRLPSGRSIVLYFYDGPISQGIAFSGLLNNGAAFAQRLVDAFAPDRDDPQLVHVATDGESYGHHHRHGEMALAYCLHQLERRDLASLTVYGEYLERYPPTMEVEIHENSSWSCVHGIERWRSDCGCNSGGHPEWRQDWRAPLRETLDVLRQDLADHFEQRLGELLRAPWEARDEYIAVILDRSEDNVRDFLDRHSGRELEAVEKARALQLLELQRHTMLMYTSCGWFFDEISGLETVQVLQYAARAIQLAQATGRQDLEGPFLERLSSVPSNVLENGAEVFEKYVRPGALDLMRVAAHYAVSSLFEDYPETAHLFAYTAHSESSDRWEAGRQRLTVGKAVVRSDITWEETQISFAVLHLGDHNINGGIREHLGQEPFLAMRDELTGAFLRSDIPEVIRLQDKHFGTNAYSLWHLFRDEQRAVLDRIRYTTLDQVESTFREIYRDNYALMNFLQGLRIPLPRAFRFTAEYSVGEELMAQLRREEPEFDRLEQLLGEVRNWSLQIDTEAVELAAEKWLLARLDQWERQPRVLEPLQHAERVLGLLLTAGITPQRWQLQNLYFRVGQQFLDELARTGDEVSEEERQWRAAFARLGELLGVRVSP